MAGEEKIYWPVLNRNNNGLSIPRDNGGTDFVPSLNI